MQIQTSLSSDGTMCTELQERQDASLVLPTSVEPLNAMQTELSSVHIGEGKLSDFTGEAAIGRIPVLSQDGTPLMPCKPAKARKLLGANKAVKKWSKLGIFYIQLAFNPKEPQVQSLVVGIDPGSKFEGISIVGRKDTVLNIMSEAVIWVKKAVETRREMRRARRYRKTRRRECRFSNRLSNHARLPPSTRARWDAKLRIIEQLKRMIPIQIAVIEDVKAETRQGQRSWNGNFSPLETGKAFFYRRLKVLGLEIILRAGHETQKLRELFKLKKLSNKSKPVFETHCVDSWVLAASVSGAKLPTTRSLYYLSPIRFHRRQLHRLQPKKGGIRRRYGGTINHQIKKGTLVKDVQYGLCYIGGNLNSRFSLHAIASGTRLTQNAKRADFKVLTRIAFRSSLLKNMGFHSEMV